MGAFVIKSSPLGFGPIEPEYKIAIEELERSRAVNIEVLD